MIHGVTSVLLGLAQISVKAFIIADCAFNFSQCMCWCFTKSKFCGLKKSILLYCPFMALFTLPIRREITVRVWTRSNLITANRHRYTQHIWYFSSNGYVTNTSSAGWAAHIQTFHVYLGVNIHTSLIMWTGPGGTVCENSHVTQIPTIV